MVIGNTIVTSSLKGSEGRLGGRYVVLEGALLKNDLRSRFETRGLGGATKLGREVRSVIKRSFTIKYNKIFWKEKNSTMHKVVRWLRRP